MAEWKRKGSNLRQAISFTKSSTHILEDHDVKFGGDGSVSSEALPRSPIGDPSRFKPGKGGFIVDEASRRTSLHEAANSGKVREVEALLSNKTPELQLKLLHARDSNGWQAIHEAARAGDVPILSYLIQLGADIGARTDHGGTPLWWARRTLDPAHPAVHYLEGIGAPEEGEDL